MFRLDKFNQYHLRYDPLFDGAEDLELFIRASRFLNLGNVQEVLLRYRANPVKHSKEFWQKQDNLKIFLQSRIASMITGDPQIQNEIKKLQLEW